MASKSVLINLGSGDLHDGFPRVTAQLWGVDSIREGRIERSLPEQYVGSLPPAPQLIRLYRNWQTVYQGLCSRFQLLLPTQLEDFSEDALETSEADALEIEEGGITNVSQFSFEELSQQFQKGMNDWLRSDSFLNIDRQVRSQLDPSEEIRVIIATNDKLLRQLPWQQWEFFKDYSKAEIALARPEYKRRELPPEQQKTRTHVRVLAILGDTQDIDIETESRFLHGLTDAHVDLLINPTRPEFTMKLWDAQGWDILFFAGHSHSEGEGGRIYLNDQAVDNSLTIEQLEEALKTAVENGLQLAIFNSCDGLGLAIALEKLHTPVAIVMREPVPNRVAQEFFKHFLAAFALERQSLYLAVQQARRKLQGLETEFPGASWLPAICQNPAVEPPTWLRLGGIPPCPYRGLAAYSETDGALFWGREESTRSLLTAVQRKPLVAVVGASGSGKSSLVKAGLIPKLQAANALVVTLHPRDNPLGNLAMAIAPHCSPLKESAFRGNGSKRANQGANPQKLERSLRQKPEALGLAVERIVQRHPGRQLVLVIESLEEIYWLCPEAIQQAFLDQILTAVRSAPGLTVVLVLRSDFYRQATAYRPLSDALQESAQWLQPMGYAELHRAIEQPAAQVGVKFEEGLSDKIIQDLGDPSRLAILAMVLSHLWSRQRQGWLTHDAYDEMGGIEKILTHHAETVYAQLNEADRLRSQRMLTQFVQWQETGAVARVASRTEVRPENWDLVTHLATVRLVTTQEQRGEPVVAIAHDRLIQSWGRLEHWMQVNGDFRRWQEQVRSAMRTWDNRKQEDELLQGKLLTDAESWKKQRSADLSRAEHDFIDRSRKRHRQQVNQDRRRILLLKGMLGLVSVAFLTVLGLGAVGFVEYLRAKAAQVDAISTNSENLFALNQRLDALLQALNAQGVLHQLPLGDQAIAAHAKTALLQSVYGADEVNRLPTSSAIVYSGIPIIKTTDPKANGLWAMGQENRIQFSQEGRVVKNWEAHQGKVLSLVFSPKNDLLLSGSEDQTAKIWRRDGTLIATLKGNGGPVRQVAWSATGTIATASTDGTVRLWSESGTLVQTLALNGPVMGVAFSPDGKTLAAASTNQVTVWRMAAGKAEPSQVLEKARVTSVHFSGDGLSLAAGSTDHRLTVWQRDRTGGFGALPVQTWEHTGAISRVRFSPDSRLVAATSWDGAVRIWSLDGNWNRTLRGHRQSTDLAFDGNSQILATSGADQTRFWQVRNPALVTLAVSTTESAPVRQAVYRSDGQLLATASGTEVKLWKANGAFQSLLKHGSTVVSLAFSPDNQTLATLETQGALNLWQLNPQTKNYEALKSFKTDGQRLIFSPDGQTLVTAGQGVIQLWSKDGRLRQTISGHQGAVQAIAYSPNGQYLVSGGEDQVVKLWKPDGMLVRTLEGSQGTVKTVAFSSDGKQIAAAGSDRHLYVWAENGRLSATMRGHQAEIRSVAFSPNGQQLVTASADQTLKIWDSNGQELATLKGHVNGVNGAVFSPDWERVASAGEDGTARLWKLELVMQPERLRSHACHLVRDYLSQPVDESEDVWQSRQFCGISQK
jgi:WD40 repeat protein/KaiC/GvpD/RAD55 family RecA-like ATPase